MARTTRRPPSFPWTGPCSYRLTSWVDAPTRRCRWPSWRRPAMCGMPRTFERVRPSAAPRRHRGSGSPSSRAAITGTGTTRKARMAGYTPKSKEFDEAVAELIGHGDGLRFSQLGSVFAREAKADSYWQMLMLEGALGHDRWTGELLSYEAPTYFGMLCAAYAPSFPDSRG